MRLKPATCAAALPVAAKTEPLAMARAKMAGGKRMMRRRSARCDDWRPSDFCSSVVLKIEVLLYLTPSMSAQDPALAPARIIEGIVPWHLNCGNFYVSGLIWEKARARHPWLSFDDFWSDQKSSNESQG